MADLSSPSRWDSSVPQPVVAKRKDQPRVARTRDISREILEIWIFYLISLLFLKLATSSVFTSLWAKQ